MNDLAVNSLNLNYFILQRKVPIWEFSGSFLCFHLFTQEYLQRPVTRFIYQTNQESDYKATLGIPLPFRTLIFIFVLC